MGKRGFDSLVQSFVLIFYMFIMSMFLVIDLPYVIVDILTNGEKDDLGYYFQMIDDNGIFLTSLLCWFLIWLSYKNWKDEL